MRRSMRAALGVVGVVVLLGAGIWLARAVSEGVDRTTEPTIQLDSNSYAVFPFQYLGTDEEVSIFAGGIPSLLFWKLTGEFGAYTADPVEVVDRWAEAGGDIGARISEADALRIAEELGAGRLVDGMVTEAGSSISVTATLLEVPTGRVLVRPMTRDGPIEERWAILDALVNELLATDYGSWTTVDLPQLTSVKPEALQAYLQNDLEAAFALDSTFYLAAYIIYRNGETDQALARYLWDHRDEMRPMDRAELLALAGWRFGETRTLAERFAQWDSAASMPGFDESLSDIVSALYQRGSLVNVFRHRERAEASLLLWRQRRPGSPGLLRMLSEIAAAEGDTAAMLRYAEEIEPVPTNAWDSVSAAAVLLRVGLLQHDADAVERAWSQADAAADGALGSLDPLSILLLDGKGLEDFDRFMLVEAGAKPSARMMAPGTGITWARARGRYADWRKIRDAWYDRWPVDGAVLRLRDALFLGEPENSAVLTSAARLDSIVTGAITVEPDPDDPEPETRVAALAQCWSTLWKVSHGETDGARQAVRYLREEVPLPHRYSVCAGLIEVLLAEFEEGDLPTAVARLDSIVRPVPMESGHWRLTRDGTHWIDNLHLSQRLLEVGDTAGALAAVIRVKPWNSMQAEFTGGIFVDLLREEAQLKAMVGDTAAAIDAYEHWLALRDTRPESPPWAAQWDSVRAEYAALTGVETS